jgi:hypothetical protein
MYKTIPTPILTRFDIGDERIIGDGHRSRLRAFDIEK